MPQTRSQAATERETTTSATTSTSISGTTMTPTTSLTPTTTPQESTSSTSEGTAQETTLRALAPAAPQTHTRSRTGGSMGSQRRLKLARARAELAKKEAELAQARVDLLEAEEDCSTELDSVEDNDDRVRSWVEEAAATRGEPLALPSADMKEENVNVNQDTNVAPPPSAPTINVNELATAITQAARNASNCTQIRPSAELPTFSGLASEWLPFKVAYEESSHAFLETENLARLRKALKGAAKETAYCLFVGATTTTEVMQLLAARFGRPDALVIAELEKLRNLPKISDSARDVCAFSAKVNNITATIRALQKPNYLYNPEVVRVVLEKLPTNVRYRYFDFADTTKEDEPDLVKFTRFLAKEADRCSRFAPLPLEEKRSEATPKRSTQRAYVTKEQNCPVCSGEHVINECTKFKNLEVAARWDAARQHRLCFRCLKAKRYRHHCKPRHCDQDGCKYHHHRLLHESKKETTSYSAEPPTVVIASAQTRSETALLKILPVTIVGPTAEENTYALLDDGSTCTLIDEGMATRVGAKGKKDPFLMMGVAGTCVEATQSQRVTLTIRGRNGVPHHIEARTMKGLELSPQSIQTDMLKNCTHLQGLEDEITYENGQPRILIGQDNWQLLLSHHVRCGRKGQPVASQTDLGWVLHGPSSRPRYSTQRVMRIRTVDTEDNMEALMREHFDLESLCVQPKRSHTEAEQRALDILEKTTRKTADGYETGLLWRQDDITPPDSYFTALSRLEGVEKKLKRDPELSRRYEAQLNTLLTNGYAEIAPTSKSARLWYLPHFAVINPEKPEKLRIVHDAAARSKGVSLNDMLLPGPDLLQSLAGVIMRFRQHAVAVTGDIKDMFLRITIREEDRDMQRFLWRKPNSEDIIEYRMRSVIFGATSSPCTAIYVKDKNAETFMQHYPEAVEAIIRNHYVDDYLASFPDENTAIRVSREVDYIHREANYQLQKWSSNSATVQADLGLHNSNGEVRSLSPEKILGLVWDSSRDTLSFNINRHKIPQELLNGWKIPTKREALRTVMSIFDPLGIAAPVTVQAKRLLQDTWRIGIGWDDELPTEQLARWQTWLTQVMKLQQLAVPRCYSHAAHAATLELHTFVDASESAYAAATYWRATTEDGSVHVSLVAAKARVAPLKTTTIPRLELQAAVLGARLATTVIEEHDMKPTRRVYWSDSRTVLAWLRNGPRIYKPFVAHRLAEISEHTKVNEWRWVPTRHNVADDATRDIPQKFDELHRWYRGPDFLYDSEQMWPIEDTATTMQHSDTTGEERTHTARASYKMCITEALPDLSRFSSYERLMRTTARVAQFIERLRRRETCAAVRKRNRRNNEDDPTYKIGVYKKTTPTRRGVATPTIIGRHTRLIPLEAHHLNIARDWWTRAVQQEAFPSEIAALRAGLPPPTSGRLSQLAVILQDDVIRLKSRIAATEGITYSQQAPTVLDGDHRWTRLYIGWVHRQLHHGGVEITINEVRTEYWVLRLRYAVRAEVKSCGTCRIRRAAPTTPSTGDHPRSRLAHHQRAFTYTGWDYFGPLTVTVGRTRQKRYGVLFTCLTTRAVHLELANNLSTDSAIMALRRFISRRGCPTELWSDQGTNLKGAEVELRLAAQDALQAEAGRHCIQWRFIPPSAPFMGGSWERLVRSVKTALSVTLHERAPKEEVLLTLLVEAEHTINSRPLTHVSTSPDDPEALTPNHFLLGGPSRVPLPGTFTEADNISKREWRISQRLADAFWARWVREYLPELQYRRDPRSHGTINVGDLVLIVDGTLPRNSWPRGHVIAAYPGPDGITRVVDVRTTKGVLRRPTKKLAILLTNNRQNSAEPAGDSAEPAGGGAEPAGGSAERAGDNPGSEGRQRTEDST